MLSIAHITKQILGIDPETNCCHIIPWMPIQHTKHHPHHSKSRKDPVLHPPNMKPKQQSNELDDESEIKGIPT
uniref:Protein OS-9 homolog n=1 Tax=Rhizophora mucronata TaxID=61149 RepID=A0A2P2JV21_RHIMU